MTPVENHEYKFKNYLGNPVDVFYSFEINQHEFRVEPFIVDGNPVSRVAPNSEEVFEAGNLPKSFKLVIEVQSIPTRNGKKAIKVEPGTVFGRAHHIEMSIEQRDDSTINVFKIHFKDFDGIPKRHEDPRIIHPEDD